MILALIETVCAAGPNYVGIATLITAGVAGFVLVYNTLRTNSIETKVDKAAAVQSEQGVVQGQIHSSVNSAAQASVAKIETLTKAADDNFKLHMQELKDELIRRDLEKAAEQAARDRENGYDAPPPRRRRPRR
jgi:hypothetical protein